MNENDTVVVIGGSSGLGLAVARRCLADGARVVIAGRSQQRLDAVRSAAGCTAHDGTRKHHVHLRRCRLPARSRRDAGRNG